MKTAITSRLALDALSLLSLRVERARTIFTLNEQYELSHRAASAFRSAAAEVTESVMVMEVFAGIRGIENHAIGFSQSGAVFIALQDEGTDWADSLANLTAEPYGEDTLDEAAQVAVSHVIALVERTLEAHMLDLRSEVAAAA